MLAISKFYIHIFSYSLLITFMSSSDISDIIVNNINVVK